jgi:glycosyltransferase involved in cell wall biosynthesis
MSPAALLERAEAAFAAGDLVDARNGLEQALAAAADDPALRAQVLNDLAVLAATEGGDAEPLLLAALADDPGYGPALENLGDACVAGGDLVQASHWLARAAQAAPTDDRIAATLAQVTHVRRRDLVVADEPAGALPGSGRVLIVVDYFHPSVGGSERLAEAAGIALQALGLEVHVATRALSGRGVLEHRGMRVHEIDRDVRARLAQVVDRGGYDALAIFSAPTAWPMVASLQLDRPRPRVVVVPCINADNAAELRADAGLLEAYARLLATADVVGISSYAGYDARLSADLGLTGVYLPNAIEAVRAAPRSFDPGPGAPVLLAVGNLWPEKDHAGLLRTLRDHPGDWRLIVIGAEAGQMPAVAEEVRRLAVEDPRVTLWGPADPDVVAAAMDAADALLLPSRAEATPLVLLEAMSRELPWIATPTCGSAHDHAGGLIVPLRLFGEAIDFLARDDAARHDLGAAGRAHWQASYTWKVMGQRYARVLFGATPGELAPPPVAIATTDLVRARFYDARPRPAVREA